MMERSLSYSLLRIKIKETHFPFVLLNSHKNLHEKSRICAKSFSVVGFDCNGYSKAPESDLTTIDAEK